MIIRPVVTGVVRPPVRGYAPDKGGGVPANALRDDLNDNSIFVDDLGDGSIVVDDLAA